MGNKTCGECRHFRDADFKDMCFWKDQHREACPDFVPLTNGDKIRQLSNENLFDFFTKRNCPPVAQCPCGVNCPKCWLDWLNAPAESEEDNERLSTR